MSPDERAEIVIAAWMAAGPIWSCDDAIEATRAAIRAALATPAASPAMSEPRTFDLIAHLERQRSWSHKTFGPGNRTQGVLDHIRKELAEIEADPSDISEWIDVVILAFDGAWRAGWEPAAVVAAMVAKQTKNEGRVWPDWRTADPNKAIEHDRRHDAPAASPSPVPAAVEELDGPITAERLAEVRDRFSAITKAEPDSLTGHVKGMLHLIDQQATELARTHEDYQQAAMDAVALCHAAEARATAAERERCAAIADCFADAYHLEDAQYRSVAAAIRQGPAS
jgi:hypothetical protein